VAPQSPDLNINKNVWAFIKIQNTFDRDRRRNEIISEIQEVWPKLFLEIAHYLVLSIPARL